MGNDKHRLALLRQAEDNVQHLAYHFRVECGGNLVEQQHLGLHGQRTGNGNALLLAARKFAWIALFLVGKPNALQKGARRFFGLRLRDLLNLSRRQRDVVDHRHMGEQIVALEHHANLLAKLGEVLFGVGNFLAVNLDGASLNRLKGIDATQERGLAASRGADNHDYLAALNGKADIFQNHVVAVGFLKMLNGEQGGIAHCLVPFLLEVVCQHADGPANYEIQQHNGAVNAEYGVGGGHAVRLDDLLANLHHLDNADHQQQAGCFDHAGDEIDRGRDKAADGLRDDYLAVNLRLVQTQCRSAFILLLRDAGKGAANQVAHFAGAPEHKHDDGGKLRRDIETHNARSAEEHDVEQHQLRHNAHDFQVQTGNNLGNRVLPRHEDTEQHAQDDAEHDGDRADLHRNPKALQKAGGV